MAHRAPRQHPDSCFLQPFPIQEILGSLLTSQQIWGHCVLRVLSVCVLSGCHGSGTSTLVPLLPKPADQDALHLYKAQWGCESLEQVT